MTALGSEAASRGIPAQLRRLFLRPRHRGAKISDLCISGSHHFPSSAPYPTQCKTYDSCRCLVRDREDRTDVDYAQNVAVFGRRSAWPIEKVGVPDDRKRRGVDAEDLHHLWRPRRFHFRPEHLKWLRVGAMHDARTRLRGRGVRAFGRRRDQRLDELVSEANNLVDTHVAADHAVRQARLKRLDHDASVGCKIRLAPCHELLKWHFFDHAPPTRMQDAHDALLAGRLGNQFDLPNALAVIAAVL